MAEEAEFKIKGAASEHAEEAPGKGTAEKSGEDEPDEDKPISDESNASEDGEVEEEEEDSDAVVETQEAQETKTEQDKQEQLKRYRWCKCICDPSQYGRDHYFLQMDTQVSQWEEPNEPYWLWDATRQVIDESGLHYPKSAPLPETNKQDSNYTGYNPKIHGHYDPNADYAQYHEKKHEVEDGIEQQPFGMIPPAPGTEYVVAGTFNRFTGSFQDAEKNSDRHNDFNKSGRQMGAYFDVDAAANAHDGRSLKEERRNEKLSKKQIKELAEKRRAKKEKKRMDFYKS